ncbi:MAG: mediator of RNA polymerase II transcription subunit 8 [Chrysothrix sp. TS-e1954]|nr:MAG: mediator of RNA polymerase II transcription subunit 8 [Chrysothrix sp. TS-e1954]
MTTLNPTDPSIRTLDLLRQRVQQLSTSLASLVHALESSDPFPPWSSLQNSFHITSYQLLELHTLLSTHADLLESAHVYPLPDFPDTTHQGMIEELLRKKLEPGVEGWIDEGLRRADAQAQAQAQAQGGGTQVGEELQGWASEKARQCFSEVVFDVDYTMEERARERGVEGVRTGLRRKLRRFGDNESESDGDDSSEGEDAAMEVDGKVEGGDKTRPPLKLEDVHRFMVTGVMP